MKMINATLFNSIQHPTVSIDTGIISHEFAPVQGTAKYICHIVYGLVIVFGIVGNIIVFHVVGYRKKKRNPCDKYILSLACTDFLASLLMIFFVSNDAITDFSSWLYGESMCYVCSAVLPATMCASGWFLALISLERYR